MVYKSISCREELQRKIEALPFWYHRIELPYGMISPGWASIDSAVYRIPEYLKEKRLLDIGAWDGYWIFEALKRGPREVVAIDGYQGNQMLMEFYPETQLP
jgi:tRNA (mo5U34)-methyltransferase